VPAYLHGFGSHVPEHVVTNAQLAELVGLTPERIESASGIRERRWATAETSVADLSVAAAEDCLHRTGVDAASLGMLIVASGSAARGFPGPAVEVAARLGMGTAPVLDLPIASAGSLFGLALAMSLAESHGNVLVVAAEKMSAVVAPLDPNTTILFGDGAGAALVSAVAQRRSRIPEALSMRSGVDPTSSASCALVTTCSGRYEPNPCRYAGTRRPS